MIDIKILRENPDVVTHALKYKAVKGVDVDEVLRLDGERLHLQKQLDTLRAERNQIAHGGKGQKPSPEIVEKGKELKAKIASLEEEYKKIEELFFTLYKKIPNIPTPDTPLGLTEDENVEVKKWGIIKEFSFTPLNHYEIAAKFDWIDKERAAKVSGSRFAYLKGELVRLQLALMSWVMDTLSDSSQLQRIIEEEGLSVSSKPFLPILPPYMIKTAPYDAMDRLHPTEERYKIEGQDLWLQGSAEHVLGSMHQDEIFSEEELPVRYIGYATSFRGEAGTYGKDMEGIIRMHQFDKLEMESFSTAETSHEEHLFFSAVQEYLMQKLELPYRKLQKCTFDIGKPNAKGSDIDVWLPGQGKYRETHTADYMTDYQARRLNTRVRRKSGDIELIHTNDATAFACGRALVGILENYQQADGSVEIPEVLRSYMGGKTHIGK
ncbi:serine--tRNA ligase [Candidatus Gracilibacteria bacterium]|nr:serine--tRNA ligase [Candidatus Gracilibacteria bacterium]